MLNGWVLAGVNAGVSSLFVNSGLAKFIGPGTLGRAVSEVAPRIGGRLNATVVRGIAALELAVAAAVLVPALRPATSSAVMALGGLFAAFGALGLLRRSTVPCGCLGGSSRHPLGPANIAIGVVLAAAGLLGLEAGSPEIGTAAPVLLTAIGSLGLCLGLHHRLVADLLAPTRPIRSGGETR